jgi:hypothetical protein
MTSMSNEFARLIDLVDAYLKSGDYMTLWSPIAGPISADREPGPFSPTEEPCWDALYEIVYMGQQESATRGEAGDGLWGGKDLHARLQEWRTAAIAALSA